MKTGAYVRIKRDGKWQSLDVGDLTTEEWDTMRDRMPLDGWKWALFLQQVVAKIPELETDHISQFNN